MTPVDQADAARPPSLIALALLVLSGAILLLFALHIAVGAKFVPISVIVQALLAPDPAAFDHSIIWNLRLPRALIAVTAGAALAVAGALMQGVTRNPLADPGLLGLTAGASLGVVMASLLFGPAMLMWSPWIAAGGALVTALAVYAIAIWTPGGPTPLTLTLTGASISAFLAALVSIAHLLNQDTFENLRVWLSGSLAGRSLETLGITAPPIAIALVIGIALAPRVTALAMGDDIAKGLGIRTGLLKLQVLLVVVVLTANAVALAGPLGFVGLVIPHVARLLVGADYRWIVPFSALIGAAFLLGTDTLARTLIAPREISTGIITAFVGAPVFVQLVRMRAR